MLTQGEFYFNIFVAVFCFLVGLICRILWYANEAPKIELFYHESSSIVSKIVSRCASLNESYIPTYLWGKNGHLQSIVHTFVGRFGRIPYCDNKRYELIAPDGSVVSYDVFQSDTPESMKLSDLVLIVPGICNHAESKYIKAFSSNLASHGFKVVVLNHTGALKTVQLRRPRIFSYGQTMDLDTVVTTLLSTEKAGKFIGLGFSLGGNILMKYLGEKPEIQKHFRFAASICQGYDIPESNALFQEWDSLRWVYNYGLTRNMLKVIFQHKDTLASYCESQQPPVDLNWDKIFAAKALHQLDKEFTLKICKENNINAFYRDNSSSQFMHNIHIPVLLVNAKDDPLIPEQLFKYPKSFIDINKNALFVVPPYGGHLGFFEGGYFRPNRISWMDRMLVEYFKVASEVIKEEVE